MKTTHLALLVGLFMGAILAFGSFADFILVTLCGVVGWAVGLYLEGRVDVQSILNWRKKCRPRPRLTPQSRSRSLPATTIHP